MPRTIDDAFLVREVWEKHRIPICLVLLVVGATSHPNYYGQPTVSSTYLYTDLSTNNSAYLVVYCAIGLGLSYRGETETHMMRGALSHLDLIITDPERSVPFYDAVLSLLGYRRVSVDGDTTVAACWTIEDAHQSVFSIALESARGRGKRRKYNRYAPGLHHVAFHVDSRADVDRPYAQLVDIGAAPRSLLRSTPIHPVTMPCLVTIPMESFWSSSMSRNIEVSSNASVLGTTKFERYNGAPNGYSYG